MASTAVAVPRNTGRYLRQASSTTSSPRHHKESTDTIGFLSSTGSFSASPHRISYGSTPRSSRGRRVSTGAKQQDVLDVGSERPLKVSDLDQSEQAASWTKRPLYYTHHRMPNHEHLTQVIRLPPMHQKVQFAASEGASWDGIAENALHATLKASGRRLTIVVLLYSSPCNPFNLGDIDVLKRAKASLTALNNVAVVGALVLPLGDEALEQRGAPQDRRLPYTVRRDITRTVLQTAKQDDWVIVDTCLGTALDQTRPDGCMQHVQGSIAPFVSIYARGRLHGKQYDIRVLEVRAEDSIEGPKTTRPYNELHVTAGKASRCPSHGTSDGVDDKYGLASIGTLVVDVSKQSQCDDLIWCAVKEPQDRQLYLALERFCGAAAARMVLDWSNNRSGAIHMKSKLLAM